MRRRGAVDRTHLAVVAFALLTLATLPLQGCAGAPPRSELYYACAPGNWWLFQGSGEGTQYTIEIRLEHAEGGAPDVLDGRVTGSLGTFTFSEQGFLLRTGPEFLQIILPSEASIATPAENDPYLPVPLQVGVQYGTDLAGVVGPDSLWVLRQVKAASPWGEVDALEMADNRDPAQADYLITFAPYLGPVEIDIADTPPLTLKNAGVK
ncbi:MAG: hypothetical protein V1748_11760 [Actinomycetota bacterium]